MQVPFRNGLLQYTCVGGNLNIPSFLTRSTSLGGYKINIRVDGASLIGTMSNSQKEYLISINNNVTAAWGTIADNVRRYLFVGYSSKGTLEYRSSTVEPQYGPTDPVALAIPHFFFNTTTNTWKEWMGSFWQVVSLLYVGNCDATTINMQHQGTFGGQMISYQSGYPLYNTNGKAILLSDKTFLTTVDDVNVQDWSVSASRLEYSLMLFTTVNDVGAFTCMKLMPDGNLSIATPSDVGAFYLCASLSSSTSGQLVDTTNSGILVNASWNWTSFGVDLYVGMSGELTDQNPFILGLTTINAVPVAKTLSSTSVIFSPPFIPSVAGGGGSTTQMDDHIAAVDPHGDRSYAASVATDAEVAAKNYADLILSSAIRLIGGYDASSNAWPSTGGSGTGGNIETGNLWFVSVPGTLGGKSVGIGDSFFSVISTPGQTNANWCTLDTNLGFVPETAGAATAAINAHLIASDPHGDRAYSVQRANHSGQQAASTISDLATAVSAIVPTSVLTGLAAGSSTVVTSSDTILTAVANLQAQITSGIVPARSIAIVTTASLAVGGIESGLIALSKSYRVTYITTSVPARVRLYATVAQRDADQYRAIGAAPTGNHGLVTEIITGTGVLTLLLTPQADGTNFESVPSINIPYCITNLSATPTAVNVMIGYLRTE